VIALGETQQRSDGEAAASSLPSRSSPVQSNGVVVDLELALFEADHGDPATAAGSRRRHMPDRPTLKAADALGWALFKSGRLGDATRRSAEALRLGTRDPVFLYHAGAIAAAAGDRAAAIRDLRAALSLDSGFSAAGAAAARKLLAGLGG
jgi:Flp pilus assembly protein TadD